MKNGKCCLFGRKRYHKAEEEGDKAECGTGRGDVAEYDVGHVKRGPCTDERRPPIGYGWRGHRPTAALCGLFVRRKRGVHEKTIVRLT